MVTLVNNLTPTNPAQQPGYDTRTEPDTRVPPKPKPMMPTVSVNDVVVPETDILEEAQHHPADNPGEALKAAARALVVRELLSQEAKRLEIKSKPQMDGSGGMETDIDAAIRSVIDKEIDIPLASDAECRRYYDNNQQRFCSEPIYEARHILLVAAPADPEARKKAKLQAATIISLLQEDPNRFKQLAAEMSACPSGKQGGNLGQITKGDTVAEFEAALTTMKKGELTAQPVETPYGFHVIALDRTIEGCQLPFEQVSQKISGWLQAASWSRAVSQYVSILAGRAKIAGIDMANSDGPLVQ
jgi:peptidyl-prolyl cis-trans isomerase C